MSRNLSHWKSHLNIWLKMVFQFKNIALSRVYFFSQSIYCQKKVNMELIATNFVYGFLKTPNILVSHTKSPRFVPLPFLVPKGLTYGPKILIFSILHWKEAEIKNSDIFEVVDLQWKLTFGLTFFISMQNKIIQSQYICGCLKYSFFALFNRQFFDFSQRHFLFT